jgi:hypothetical protein
VDGSLALAFRREFYLFFTPDLILWMLEFTHYEGCANMEISIDSAQFRSLVLSFPCFSEADSEQAPDELLALVLAAFNEDNLTEEQDLVVELVLHLHSPEAQFNLRRSLEVWSKGDKEALARLICK